MLTTGVTYIGEVVDKEASSYSTTDDCYWDTGHEQCMLQSHTVALVQILQLHGSVWNNDSIDLYVLWKEYRSNKDILKISYVPYE